MTRRSSTLSGPDARSVIDQGALIRDYSVRRVVAKTAHEIPERPSLHLAVGDQVEIGERDTQWPEFDLVTAAHESSWVSARQLSASSGNTVALTACEPPSWWCARRAVSLRPPAIVPAGALAGVAPGSLGIWLGESPR